MLRPPKPSLTEDESDRWLKDSAHVDVLALWEEQVGRVLGGLRTGVSPCWSCGVSLLIGGPCEVDSGPAENAGSALGRPGAPGEMRG